MILETFEKQPDEIKDYDIDYSDWLALINDTVNTIVSIDVVCLTDPSDTSLVCALSELMPSFIKLWMTGGTHGHKYKVTALVTTVGQRTDESELIFIVKNR